MGDFGIVVVPRDGADTERIMNHSSILRKYKVRAEHQLLLSAWTLLLERRPASLSRLGSLFGFRTTSSW